MRWFQRHPRKMEADPVWSQKLARGFDDIRLGRTTPMRDAFAEIERDNVNFTSDPSDYATSIPLTSDGQT